MSENPEVGDGSIQPVTTPKVEIPPPLKWAGVIIAALMTLTVSSGVAWAVSTLNQLQITVARMDERQQRDTTPARLEKIEERLMRLEQVRQEDKP
jgi:hypothetical protein